MTVESAVIWFNPKLGCWVFSLSVRKKKILGRSLRLEYSAVLPNVR